MRHAFSGIMVAVAAAALLVPTTVRAQTGIQIRIGDGGSVIGDRGRDALVLRQGVDAGGFDGWMDVDSFSWGSTGAAPPSSGSGRGVLVVRRRSDGASPRLRQAHAEGQRVAVLELRVPGGDGARDHMVITMRDVLISSYQRSSADGPTEEVAFVYQGIHW